MFACQLLRPAHDCKYDYGVPGRSCSGHICMGCRLYYPLCSPPNHRHHSLLSSGHLHCVSCTLSILPSQLQHKHKCQSLCFPVWTNSVQTMSRPSQDASNLQSRSSLGSEMVVVRLTPPLSFLLKVMPGGRLLSRIPKPSSSFSISFL